MKPLSEAQLQRAAEDLLEVCRRRGLILDWYHRPDRAAGHRERAGLPDLLIAIGPGRVAAIELKSARGKVRPEQQVWLDAFGGYVCRSLDEVRTALRWLGVDTTGISEKETTDV